jgi:glycosyltransferase involved in cell wall biosynthesis
MKFALILMIKNEEKILKRCLDAVKDLVDCFCIFDTGSTDSTCEIAKEYLNKNIGCLNQEPFRDFGYSRTQSFLTAQTYIRDTLKWDLSGVYGILLDADMMFVQGTLKQQNLTEPGYKIIQLNGNLEYYNARIIRMDVPWKCLGVTHEYWDGPCNTNLGKEVCYIDDRNDGGCKHDKFERDQRLLEEGLSKEPTNVRYMFYLAQTLKCIGKFKESIEMYKKRIEAGGWVEEVWYSYYMIAECYLNLKDITEFENWSQKAFIYRSHRSEPLLKLAKFFREIGHCYKAYQYIQAGEKVPFPKNDSLFIESDIYKGLFEYEKSIVEYYIHPEKCLKTTIQYMMKLPHFQQNCVSNLKFSVKPLNSKITKLNLPSVFGEDFRTSAISLDTYPLANVRYINYWIENGDYKTKGGDVQTHNAYINLETNEIISMMKDESITLSRFNTNVKGLEDIRLFRKDNKLKFNATSVKEYTENQVRVIYGDYNLDGTYSNLSIINTPQNCEKNWLPISNTNMSIYGWHPYTIITDTGDVIKQSNTPPLFSLFRGSAPPIRYNDGWLCLVHFVEYCKPRIYYHCFIELDKALVPQKLTLPFTFKSNSIEYCVSFRFQTKDTIEAYVSFMDKDSSKVEFDVSSLQWINLNGN